LASIFSKLVSEGRLSVLDALSVDAPKTKLLAAKINDMGLKDARVMIITDNIDENMYLASRNLPNVLVVEVHQADPVSLVRFPNVLVTRSAIAKIEEMLA
jgi:large subunit ribosomal protein L4